MSKDSQPSDPFPGIAEMAAASIKLPPLSESFVDIWFARAEAMFLKAGIKAQDTKFAHIISILSDDQMVKVHKAITEPRKGHEYDDLRDALKGKLKKSSFENVYRLVTEEQLGAQLPSELLCYCEMLVQPQDRDTDLFKQLFLMKLPAALYGQLSADLSLELKDIVTKADAIVIGSRGTAGAHGNQSLVASVVAPPTDSVETLSGKLDVMIEALNVKHSKPGHVGKPGECHFHQKWGERAFRCQMPCSWNGRTASKPQAPRAPQRSTNQKVLAGN